MTLCRVLCPRGADYSLRNILYCSSRNLLTARKSCSQDKWKETEGLLEPCSSQKRPQSDDILGPDLLQVDNEISDRVKYKPRASYRERREYQAKFKTKERRAEDNNRNKNYWLRGKAKNPEWIEFSTSNAHGEYLFGIYPVLLALKYGKRIFHKLYIREGTDFRDESKSIIRSIKDLAEEKGVPVEYCSKPVLNYMSYQRPHQGVCLDASKKLYVTYKNEVCCEVEAEKEHTGPELWLLLSSVQDPMNFGSILRSAYYLGTQRIFAFNSCALSPVVSKTSAGAVEFFNIYEVKDVVSFLKEQKQNGILVLGTAANPPVVNTQSSEAQKLQTTPVQQTSLHKSSLLIIGNEGSGLSEEVLNLCDQIITIPSIRHLQEELDSLNVSVATGILQYHLLTTRTPRCKLD